MNDTLAKYCYKLLIFNDFLGNYKTVIRLVIRLLSASSWQRKRHPHQHEEVLAPQALELFFIGGFLFYITSHQLGSRFQRLS